MKRFTVTMTDHFPRIYFKVVVYPTMEDLQIGAARYDGRNHPDGGGGWSTVMACYHPPDTTRSNYGGTIRFAETDMDTAVIVHEAFHAAMGVYRKSIKPRVNLGGKCGKAEENLAYVLDDVYSSLVAKLKEEGF